MSLIAFKSIHAETTDVTVGNFVPAGTAKITTTGCDVKGDSGVAINPSIQGKNINLEIIAKNPRVKDTSGTLYYTTQAGIFPSLTHKYLGGKEHTFTLGLRNGTPLGYTWKQNEGVFNGVVSTKLGDWLSTSASLTCRLTSEIIAGASVEYDPFRSGLKSYTIGLKHSKFGALTVDATRAFTLTSARKATDSIMVYGLLGANRAGQYSAVVAGKFSSPCGGAAYAKVDAVSGNAAVTISKMREGNWLPRVTANVNLYKAKFQGLGISFSREDI